MIRRFPLARRIEEAEIDAEVELELATLDICDEVRRCGTVGADSMWETFLGRWSEAEAATHWNDWLTGPPGFFG